VRRGAGAADGRAFVEGATVGVGAAGGTVAAGTVAGTTPSKSSTCGFGEAGVSATTLAACTGSLSAPFARRCKKRRPARTKIARLAARTTTKISLAMMARAREPLGRSERAGGIDSGMRGAPKFRDGGAGGTLSASSSSSWMVSSRGSAGGASGPPTCAEGKGGGVARPRISCGETGLVDVNAPPFMDILTFIVRPRRAAFEAKMCCWGGRRFDHGREEPIAVGAAHLCPHA